MDDKAHPQQRVGDVDKDTGSDTEGRNETCPPGMGERECAHDRKPDDMGKRDERTIGKPGGYLRIRLYDLNKQADDEN